MTVHLLIINLMPDKQATEQHFKRITEALSFDIQTEYLYLSSHHYKNTSISYLKQNYKCLNDIKDTYYDVMIITGAALEHLEFNEVTYIDELNKILKWSKDHVKKRIFICWAAQYALFKNYGIHPIKNEAKLSGVYLYNTNPSHPLYKDIQHYYVPQSRYMRINPEVKAIHDLNLISYRDNDIDIITNKTYTDYYFAGHLEYDQYTLAKEYERDIKINRDTPTPENYFIDGTTQPSQPRWYQDAENIYKYVLNNIGPS
ncbi:homoserine O-succinyltransferase [Macrococcoides canis]|uniref:homoserine O-acetyltransferase/O-succinyltransferase family protein n=1 Tax=Macrococcoides canis TaxID=1855823 RepID=UPI0020B8AFA4|nr:homoserine O-succinyltransferase [Macrococcus canis]UTH02532.1 homoserine O-succinyltransferase [Macrococcus canis]